MPFELIDLDIDEVSSVDRPANKRTFLILKRAEDAIAKAPLSTSSQDDLPDSAFAYVETGTKDSEGKTTPRSLRHLPYRTKDGSPDKAHLRNALARLDQTNISASAKASARRKLEAAAKEVGIDVTKDGDGMAPDAEPDGDEAPPLDYATRTRQRDLWQSLWDKLWRFQDCVYDIMGDADTDNIPNLPILVTSIGQFQADVAALLDSLGLVEKAAPALTLLAEVSKAGAAMALHRRDRLKDAIALLEALLEECTPPNTDANLPLQKGAAMAETLEGITKRAEAAEAVIKDLTQQHDLLTKRVETADARVQELEPLVAKVADLETTIVLLKKTPEEQEAEYRANLPEPVRKRLEAGEAKMVELQKRLQEADEQRERVEYITKTAAYRPLGMAQKHWTILKAIDGIAEEDREELHRLLKAATAQLQTSKLFESLGHADTGDVGEAGATAEAQLDRLAKAYQAEKGVDYTTALTVIVKQQPDLWERNTQEKRRSNRVASQ